MRDKWYAEQRHFDGSLRPVIYYGDKPSSKRPEGGKKSLYNIHKIPPELGDWTVTQLHLYFNKQGTTS